MTLDSITAEIHAELARAQTRVPYFADATIGYNVLAEAVAALRYTIECENPKAQRFEAIQVAAMAIKFLQDVCGE